MAIFIKIYFPHSTKTINNTYIITLLRNQKYDADMIVNLTMLSRGIKNSTHNVNS